MNIRAVQTCESITHTQLTNGRTEHRAECAMSVCSRRDCADYADTNGVLCVIPIQTRARARQTHVTYKAYKVCATARRQVDTTHTRPRKRQDVYIFRRRHFVVLKSYFQSGCCRVYECGLWINVKCIRRVSDHCIAWPRRRHRRRRRRRDLCVRPHRNVLTDRTQNVIICQAQLRS